MTITSNVFLSVNVGSAPNDGTGDPLRTSFQKINDNFAYFTDPVNGIWPNIQIKTLTSQIYNIVGISTFNRIQADWLESSTYGNNTSEYSGNVYYGNSFIGGAFLGAIGQGGANVAYFTSLDVNATATVGSLTSNGSISANTYNGKIGTITPNTADFTNVTASGSITVGTYVVKSIEGSFANTGAALTVNLSATVPGTQMAAYTLSQNATISYGGITPGTDKFVVFRNFQDNTIRSITLPTNFNNKGSTSFNVGANANVMCHFFAFDSTQANVYVNITNS